MTENKRFKCVSDYDWWGVIDITGEIKGEYDNDCFSTDTVVDLLNELAEENQRLKNDCSILVQSNQEYRKENEQLKCGNKNLKAILNDFINICNRLQANPNDKQTVAVARDMLENMGVDLE